MPPFHEEESNDYATDSGSSDNDTTYTASQDTKIKNCIEKSNDPFLYYSNDEIRIKTLKMNEDPLSIELQGLAKMATNQTKRKTRISFEMHPDAVMGLEDMLDVIGDITEDDIDFDLGLDDSITETDLFRELLQLYER